MADLKEKSAALSSALNLEEMHQKHIHCSKQLSNNAIQISNIGKQHPKTVQNSACPSTGHLDKCGKTFQNCH
jgi:hypothetical protein